MIITKVELVNWRSHEHTILEFSNGTNVFVGIMGSGKSSVLDAVSYALFGRFPKSDRRDVKINDIIRFGEKHSKVQVWFSTSEKKYMVSRAIGNDSAELYEINDGNNSLIQKDKARVTKTITSILGTDYSIFVRAIYSEQNNIDYFFNLAPRKRKEEFDTLLGIDRFYTALSNTTRVINWLDVKAKDIAAQYSDDMFEQCKENVLTTEKQLNELKKKSEHLMHEHEDVRKKYESEKINFNQIQSLKKQYQTLKDTLTSLKGKIENLESQADKLHYDAEEHERLENQAVQSKTKANEVKQQHSLFLKEQNNIYGQLSGAREKVKRYDKITKTLSEFEKEINDSEMTTPLSEELKSADNSLQDRKMLFLSAKQRINELKRSIKELSPGISRCPLCGSELTEEHVRKLVTESKEQIKKIEQDIKNTNQEIKNFTEKRDSIKTKIMDLEKKRSLCESFKKEKQALAGQPEQIEVMEKQHEHILNKIIEIEKILEQTNEKEKILTAKLMDIGHAKQVAESLDKTKKDYVKLQNELQQINYNEEKYMVQYDTIKNYEKKIETLFVELKGLEQVVNEKNNMLSNYKKELMHLQNMYAKAQEYRMKNQELRKFRNSMNETIVELRGYIINALNVAVERLWPTIYPYGDYDAIRIEATDKDYLLMLHINNRGWVPISQVASGGEKMCAALILRIALAIVLSPDLGWLVLDEPTHNLDTEAVELMAAMLEEKVPTILNQTFVITHDQTLLARDYDRIYLFKRDKVNGKSTVVERIR